MIDNVLQNWPSILIWGAVATSAMTTILEGSRQLGWSRMSLPFLFGTFVTTKRGKAIWLGFILYVTVGWVFAFLYAAAFESLDMANWWLGGLLSFLHGLFLLAVFLPMVAALHPRMATGYDNITPVRRLEPPGPFGLNYGVQTPLVTIAGQMAYGIVLGIFYPLQGGA